MEAGRTRWSARWRWISSAVLCLVIIPLLASDKAKQQNLKEQDSARIHDPSQYVGSQECKTCHEAEFKSYDHGAHWKIGKDPKGDVTKQGCEGCHGPGKAHAEEGGKLETLFRFTGRTAESSSKQCLTCHEFSESHSNFLRSEHVKNGVGCVDCHSEHKPKIEQALLKDKQPKLCFASVLCQFWFSKASVPSCTELKEGPSLVLRPYAMRTRTRDCGNKVRR